MSDNKILDVFQAMVKSYHGISLGSGEVLQSSTSKVSDLPLLLWSVRGWQADIWQPPFKYNIKWDLPARLSVVGESGKPDPLLNAIDDIDSWSSFIYGLPLDSDGVVVPYGTVRYFQLERLDQLHSIAERFVGPYISKVAVQPDVADNSYAWADLIMHVEFLVDATPQEQSVARFFQVGANILQPNHANNITRIGDPYTLPQPADADVRAQGGFAKPDTVLLLGGIAGTETDGGFPPLVQDIPAVEGTGDPVKEILIFPGSFTIQVSFTQQLTAILFRDSGITESHSFTWASTNQNIATVDQNGLVAAVAIGSTTITASYGGTTGSATITTTGLSLDFTTLAGAGSLTFSRTGGDIILPRSATTAVRLAAGAAVLFQDYGQGHCGAWSLAGHTQLTPNNTDLQSGWSLFNGLGPNAASPTTDPLGTTAAGRLTDSVNQTLSLLRPAAAPYATGNTKASLSLWYADVAANPPTTPGAVTGATFPANSGTPYLTSGIMPSWGPSLLLQSGTTWKRRATWYIVTSATAYYDIRVAGLTDASYSVNPSATGSLDVFAPNYAVSNADIPTVLGACGAVSPTLSSMNAGLIVTGGVLSCRARAFNQNWDITTLPQQWLWSATSTDGTMGVRYTPTTDTWELFVRGSSVLSCVAGWNTIADGTGYSYTGETFVDVGYDTGANKSYIRVWVGGCLIGEATGTTTGGALAAATAAWLGSNLGGGTPANLLHTGIATAPTSLKCEGLVVGDSIMSWTNVTGFNGVIRDIPAWGSFIYTPAQARTKPGIGSCAHPGDTIANQQTAFDTWIGAHDTTGLKWVLIQVGINDIRAGTTPATIAASLNTLTAHIKAALPSVKIVINRMTPAGGQIGGGSVGNWTTVNTDIDGTGPNPIMNVDVRVSANSTVLDNGSGSLLTAYSQDGIHINAAGKLLAAAADITAITSLGFLP